MNLLYMNTREHFLNLQNDAFLAFVQNIESFEL